MNRLPFFAAECKYCNRRNQLPIRQLGRQTNCNYCGQNFTAVGADSTTAALDDPLHYWINFTEHSILESDSGLPDPYPFNRKSNTRTPR